MGESGVENGTKKCYVMYGRPLTGCSEAFQIDYDDFKGISIKFWRFQGRFKGFFCERILQFTVEKLLQQL